MAPWPVWGGRRHLGPEGRAPLAVGPEAVASQGEKQERRSGGAGAARKEQRHECPEWPVRFEQCDLLEPGERT